jgi:hypothetical protein
MRQLPANPGGHPLELGRHSATGTTRCGTLTSSFTAAWCASQA